MRARWLWTMAGLGLGLVAAVWAASTWAESRRQARELEQAKSDMASGRFHRALPRLVELVRSGRAGGETAFQLGNCEEAIGHLEKADKAWAQVPASSPFAVKAALGRTRALMGMGKFSAAEAVFGSLKGDLGPDAMEASHAHEVLLRIEGRIQEAREVIINSWQSAEDASYILRRLYILEDAAFPLEFVRKSLSIIDPQDDRGWLGRANLATWTGQLDEAARLLDSCEKLRPDDQPIWLARLALALARRDPASARSAADRLQPRWFFPPEVLRLRAWLASFGDDRKVERQCLQALVVEEPGNTNAWARLSELALADRQVADAETYRRKQTAAADLRVRYTKLIMSDDRQGHAAELAQVAQGLGRRLEARGWSLIAEGRVSEPLWLPEQTPQHAPSPGEMLASLIGDLPALASAQKAKPAVADTLNVPVFRDDAQTVGLVFVQDAGHSPKPQPPPETMCGGVALLDYNRDGWVDVYAVQAGPFPPTHLTTYEGDRLFRNRGDGTFEDVTEQSGIARLPREYGNGVTVGDFDNDGWPDLFITRWRGYALYRNLGNGKFDDRTRQAGLAGDRDWPTSAAFADLDGDGDLDLYVCHYFIYDPDNPRQCGKAGMPPGAVCMPLDFPSLPDHVFRNDGGKFVDVTAQAGFTDPNGRGLGVLAAHLDDDDRIDLLVSNDMTANYLFRNLGGFRFEENGPLAGLACAAEGFYKSGMGIACGDLNGDGKIDVAVTNFFGESTTFFSNMGGGFFIDQTSQVGLMQASRPLLGFGLSFLDGNNDGWLDMLSVNGHIFDGRPQIPYTMPMQLFAGVGGGRLKDVSARAGEPFGPLHLSRGLAVGDVDNDGRIDAVVLGENEPLLYLHNITENSGHFLSIRLEGTRSNRDAIGARVAIVAGGRRQVAERWGGGSYQSASDPRLHFGLGEARTTESLEIRWPSGQTDRHTGLQADRGYLVREGAATVTPYPPRAAGARVTQ